MASLTGWIEGIVLSLMIFAAFSASMTEFDDFRTPFSLDNMGVDNHTDRLISYQDSVAEGVEGSEADWEGADGGGIELEGGPGIMIGAASTVWAILTGSWISNILTDWLGFPATISRLLTLVFFLSIGFIILQLITKVKT